MGQEKVIRWDRRRCIWVGRVCKDGTGEHYSMGQKKLIYIQIRRFFGNKCPIFTRVKTIVIRIVR
jgi:hypothetical protein